jgi:outer membrane protein assembly factor BamB
MVGSSLTAPSMAAPSWKDVRFQIGSDRNVRTATYDPRTGRIFVLTRLPFQTTPGLAAFAPGRSKPIWKRTFAHVPDAYGDGMSFGHDLLVVPKRNLVYVGGGYMGGTGAGPFKSAGWLYAFDTRTGKRVWSHTDRTVAGMGSIYDNLEKGPRGSVVALQSQLKSGPDNSSGSYAIEAASFDQRGRQRWRWVDKPRGLVSDSVTARGLMVVVGETYIEGWARGYRLAIDMRTGRPAWRKVGSDPYEFFDTVTAIPTGETLYVAGSHHGVEEGSEATLGAFKTASGRFSWKRRIYPPTPTVPGDVSYYSTSAVTSTRQGPCVTGDWDGRRAVTYEAILPDDGFIACYSAHGKRRWIDRSTAGQGRVLETAGRRLLWMGRQEINRNDNEYSEEAVRFEIRSLDNGTVQNSSERLSTTDSWEPSQPLLAFRRADKFHFALATATAYDGEGNHAAFDGFMSRTSR